MQEIQLHAGNDNATGFNPVIADCAVSAEGAGHIKVSVRCDDDWSGWAGHGGLQISAPVRQEQQIEHDQIEDHPKGLQAPSPSPGTPQMMPDRQIFSRSPKPSSSLQTGFSNPQTSSQRDMNSAFPKASPQDGSGDEAIDPDMGLNQSIYRTLTAAAIEHPEDVSQEGQGLVQAENDFEDAQQPTGIRQQKIGIPEDDQTAFDESDDEEEDPESVIGSPVTDGGGDDTALGNAAGESGEEVHQFPVLTLQFFWSSARMTRTQLEGC